MVEWTPAEVATASKALGLPLWKVRQMVATGVLDKEKALNGFAMPEGGIRFIVASEKYHIPKSTLSRLVHQGKVRELARLSHKFSVLAEEDVKALMKET